MAMPSALRPNFALDRVQPHHGQSMGPLVGRSNPPLGRHVPRLAPLRGHLMPSTAHPRRPAKPSHRPHSFRPRLESLEVRDLMSVYVVNTLTDTGAGVGRIGDLRYCLTH